MNKYTLIIFLTFAFLAQGKALVADGDKISLNDKFFLSELTKEYAKLFGKNLSMPEGFKDSEVRIFGPAGIKQENLFDYLSFALWDAGYTLLSDKKTNTLEVSPARDVRYAAMPTYKNIDEVPKNFNYVKFAYKMKHVGSGDLARNMRPFMSRYGRVIDGPEGKSLVVSDVGKNIHRLYDLLKLVDTEEFKKSKAAVEKINKEASVTVKKDKGILSALKDQHALFIAAFSLIFGIIGFTLRGYMIKRIEGGW